jgi:predicted Zn-dependent protease
LEPLLGLAEVQNKAGAYGDSLASYQRTLELEPKNLTAQLGSARDLVALGRVSAAKDLLKQAEVDHADSSQIHFELSRVYMREGASEEAAKETQIVQRLRAQAPASNGKPQ